MQKADRYTEKAVERFKRFKSNTAPPLRRSPPETLQQLRSSPPTPSIAGANFKSLPLWVSLACLKLLPEIRSALGIPEAKFPLHCPGRQISQSKFVFYYHGC
ncbi:hypothetical protein Y1Q_0005291 [Alligator mississippiensis]|uniref:Uncharacterized protein n=1 Tax=Alligator mississippiensis TaxID=8496 RepID=A0A151MTA9_ALLMI|nr:hypothetical protein Y1Q_0005291 [Alligator mississippiensis]